MEEQLIRTGLRRGRLRPPAPGREPAGALLVEAGGLPDGARCHIGLDSKGHCLFFDAPGGRLCAIHRDLGPEALPSACRHFPRLALIAPQGVSVSLSHYCPTAAGLLFDDRVSLAIVTQPSAFPSDAEYEGLDARGHVPPLLRPGVLLGWDAHERWEAHLVTLFAREDAAPEAAVARLGRLARAAAAWSLRDGPFDSFFSTLLERDSTEAGRDSLPPPRDEGDSIRRLWERVIEATAPGLPKPPFPAAFEDLWTRCVASGWERRRRFVNRYLAARGFASWYALLAPSLEAATHALAAALAVLKVECVRRAESEGSILDAEDLREAIRASDLRIVHHARPEVLGELLATGVIQSPK